MTSALRRLNRFNTKKMAAAVLHADTPLWHPSKPAEDNLRGYAETGGEMAGGIVGAVGGFVGGGMLGGPVAPITAIGGSVGAGYIGGKSGKSLGRNTFNLVWGSRSGVDSFGRSTGYGSDNGRYGDDFTPQLDDVVYLVPMAGGALDGSMISDRFGVFG